VQPASAPASRSTAGIERVFDGCRRRYGCEVPPRYKFVEVSPVTAEALEAAVNEWIAQGWQLEGIRFLVADPSSRPQLAFVSFVTSVAAPAELAAPAAEVGPRPIEPPPPEQAARVIVAPHGDEVE
jgi:hypothetical protein